MGIRDSATADETVFQIVKRNWHQTDLSAEDKALCDHASKLTRTPGRMTQADVETLRTHGFGDREILDITQVIAYFNYITRIAEGLGVPPETFSHAWDLGPP